MDIQKVLRILEICIPVFGMIGLGKIFQLTGLMTQDHRQFVNKLVYYFCLPALVFIHVAAQEPKMFLNGSLAVAAILPIILTTLVYFIIAKIFGMKGGFAAAFIFGSFYANTAYMGFPLTEEAFGNEGLAAAAIVNTMCIPAYMITAFIIIGWFGAGDRIESIGTRVKKIIFNPFILACVIGVITSVILSFFRDAQGELELPVMLLRSGGIFVGFLKLVAQMGLPLALLAIGGVLHFSTIKRSLVALGADLFGKLILVPGFTLLGFMLLFPNTASVYVGPAVLLQAMPNAVVSYVIACQIGVDEGFVSAQLVLSTIFSAITIPVWIYILM